MDIDWFNKRVGKKVKAYSSWWGIERIVTIKNKNHASELYNWYFKYKNWVFNDL